MSNQIFENFESIFKDDSIADLANNIKGSANEIGINMFLYSFFKEPEYIILRDLLFPYENNVGSAQIDLLLISVYGIFVIEAKNYQGVIYGSENSYQWTEYLYGNKYEFMNPIRQNYGHIKCIEPIIKFPKRVPIYSAVLFSEDCELKVRVQNSFVGYTHEFPGFLQSFTNPILSVEEVKNISEQLKNANIASADNFAQHKQETMEKKEKFEKKVSFGICPRCGGKLVLRTAKRGENKGRQFYGCSNFPKCRYIQNI